MLAKRFKKLPVEIEAMQWNGKNSSEVIDWVFTHDEKFPISLIELRRRRGPFLSLSTLEGVMRANRNDWIIRGVNGEFYPCKPDIFEKTYEIVDDEPCSNRWLKVVSQFYKELQKIKAD